MAECQSHLGRITRPRAFKIFGSQSAKPTKRRDVAYDGWRLRFRHSEKLLRGPTIAWRPLGVRGCKPSGLWLGGSSNVLYEHDVTRRAGLRLQLWRSDQTPNAAIGECSDDDSQPRVRAIRREYFGVVQSGNSIRRNFDH